MSLMQPHPNRTPATDRFFEDHLAGVRARLEAHTKRALARQRTAWRDMLHREALLEGRDFAQTDQD